MLPRKRLIPFAAALFLSLAIIVPPSLPLLPNVRSASATRTFSLVGFALTGWNASEPSGPNPTIIVTQGDKVTINLLNGDYYVTHRFWLDTDRDALSDMSDCPTSDSCSNFFSTYTSITFTASVAGTFTYYCTVHPTVMFGTFIVQPSGGGDFGVSSNPSTVSTIPGSNVISTVTVASFNNFAGQVTLSAASSIVGASTSFTVNPVTVAVGGSVKSLLTVSLPSSVPAGSYEVTVTAANTTVSHSAMITLTVKDYTLTANPNSIIVPRESSANTLILLNSLEGFTGAVSLSVLIVPALKQGPAVALSSTLVALSSGGSASVILTVSAKGSAPLGSYFVDVAASSGSLSHSVSVSITVVVEVHGV